MVPPCDFPAKCLNYEAFLQLSSKKAKKGNENALTGIQTFVTIVPKFGMVKDIAILYSWKQLLSQLYQKLTLVKDVARAYSQRQLWSI